MEKSTVGEAIVRLGGLAVLVRTSTGRKGDRGGSTPFVIPEQHNDTAENNK